VPITLLPSLILFSVSKVVVPVAYRMDPRYLNLLTALICLNLIILIKYDEKYEYSYFHCVVFFVFLLLLRLA
jgi:hypothetical protein